MIETLITWKLLTADLPKVLITRQAVLTLPRQDYETASRTSSQDTLAETRSLVKLQTTLSNANDAQSTVNVKRFEAAMQVIKECQEQIRELQNDTVRHREEISLEIMFWRNQEAEWKKQLPFYKECIIAPSFSTTRQKRQEICNKVKA
jgi:hypothetical protein